MPPTPIHSQTAGQPLELCPWCGQLQAIVWVHGHGQCAHCHTNIAPCCSGDSCEAPSAE
jgi:hypothetical protein